MAKKENTDSAGDKYPSAHPAVVNKEEVITNLKKYVEVERAKRNPSDVVGSPEWSEKVKAKQKASIFPKHY